MKYVWIYAAVLSAAAFVLCGADKLAARKGFRRVPERTFFLLSLLGGAMGMTCGMFLFRHKTKHFWFMAVIPAAAVLQTALLVWLTVSGVQLVGSIRF